MTNYLPVVLDQAGHQWLLSLPENQFDSWAQLKQDFIDNFIATCDQSGNKYDLERIRDRKDEAVSAFIKGLHHHDALRSKLLQKWPTTVSELLATAKNYADTDDAENNVLKLLLHVAF
jgi:hypothetical protein